MLALLKFFDQEDLILLVKIQLWLHAFENMKIVNTLSSDIFTRCKDDLFDMTSLHDHMFFGWFEEIRLEQFVDRLRIDVQSSRNGNQQHMFPRYPWSKIFDCILDGVLHCVLYRISYCFLYRFFYALLDCISNCYLESVHHRWTKLLRIHAKVKIKLFNQVNLKINNK